MTLPSASASPMPRKGDVDAATVIEIELVDRAQDDGRVDGGAEQGAIDHGAVVAALLDGQPVLVDGALPGEHVEDTARHAEAEIDHGARAHLLGGPAGDHAPEAGLLGPVGERQRVLGDGVAAEGAFVEGAMGLPLLWIEGDHVNHGARHAHQTRVQGVAGRHARAPGRSRGRRNCARPARRHGRRDPPARRPC